MLSLMNRLKHNTQLKVKRRGMSYGWVPLLAVSLMLVMAGCTPPGADALMNGRERLDKGDVQEAIKAFEKATNFMPESARAWNYLGLAYHRDGQFIAARDAYDKSWSKDDNLAQSKFNKGCLLLETGQYALAITLFKTFQMLKPQSKEVLPKLALAYYGEGELETARSIYEDILRQNEKMPSAWNGIGLILVQEGKFREAYDYFDTALKHQSNFSPSLFNQGVIAYPSLKRPDLAVKKLREFTFQAPDSALTPRAKSMANSLEDRLLSKTTPEPANMEVAIQDKTTANSNQVNSQKPNLETLEPTNQAGSAETTEPAVVVIQDEETSSHQTNLAELSESSAAEKKQSASNPQPETNLAEVQPDISDQENEPAPQRVASATETNPAKPGVDQPIGMRTDKAEWVANPTEETVTITSDTDLKKAGSKPPLVRSSQPGVTPLPEGLPFNPYKYLLPGAPLPGNRNEAASWFKKGNRAFQRNDYEEAVEAYEKAVIEDPAYFEAYFNLGLAALRGGNASKALPACELALAIQPNHRDSRYNLSLALEKLNHFRDAARELETLLKENADDTQILMRLGNLYSEPLQRPVRTREVYSHLLKLSPGSPESRTAQRWLYENP